MGLNAGKRSLKKPVKSVVLVARPKSFAEAIKIANEAEAATQQNGTVMDFIASNRKNFNWHRNNNFRAINFKRNNLSHNQYRGNNNRNDISSEYNSNYYVRNRVNTRSGNSNDPGQRIPVGPGGQ